METKLGDSYSGMLLYCDKHMNLHLGDVRKSRKTDDPSKPAAKVKEAFIKGVGISSMRMLPEVVTQYREQKEAILKELGKSTHF